MSVAEWPLEIGDVEKTNGVQDRSTFGELAHPLKGVPGVCDQWHGCSEGSGSHLLSDANLFELSAKTGEDLDTLAQHARMLAALCGRAPAGAPKNLRTH